MSRFFSVKFADHVAYVPGEQPREQKYIKLNTNENPFPPSPLAQQLACQAAGDLALYPDPHCTELTRAACEKWGVAANEIIFGNSSDVVLSWLFIAFCDHEHVPVFADVTYGFYPVFASFNGLTPKVIPLQKDLTIRPEDYYNAGGTVFIVNPNADVGLALTVQQVADIVEHNPDNVVVIDEAYVDFGAETVLPLIHKYPNLAVTRTFSKSYSMAGARLGCVMADEGLIGDLQVVKNSINPYSVNRMSMAAGQGALLDEEYFEANRQKIMENRAYTIQALKDLGFATTNSLGNFVPFKSDRIHSKELFGKLKEEGILVRFFSEGPWGDYNRVSIGSREEMETFIRAVQKIMEASR